MPTSAHPRVTATAAPRPRTGTARGRPPPGADPLPAAVDAGRAWLCTLSVAEQTASTGDLEHRLRTAPSTSRPTRLGDTAARIACAHLAAGDLTEAYSALLVARDQLLSEPPLSTGSTSSRTGQPLWSGRGWRPSAQVTSGSFSSAADRVRTPAPDDQTSP